jgi:hypothetical protein
MPIETPVIWFFGPFPRPLDSPLAKTTPHSPDIGHAVIALRPGHESVESTQMDLNADLRLKEEVGV